MCDDHTMELLGQIPKSTLVYFVNSFNNQDVPILMKKEKAELQRLIIARGKADMVIESYAETEAYIDLHKGAYLYFLRAKDEEEWHQVSFSRVQYLLENGNDGQFGNALLYCLLSFHEASNSNYEFKVKPKIYS